ncbi:MAG: DNA polymerase I [Candidatus Omnitrophica bacterium]|nr:DNA polymerase I [Candidatus Omnitrophota bacterium]
MSKIFLIDGNSFCYRAFYAIRQLSNSRGEPTNAIYGFVTMLRKMIKDEKPEGLAVSFDLAGPTFRHAIDSDYKAHRKPMPDDLVTQIPHIKEFVRAMRIPIYEKEGFEADDVLGTLARKLARAGHEVYIVTGDKDMLQLVNDRVKVYNPSKEGLIFDEGEVRKKFDGLGPDKVVDVMALAGDASDNIPGVPKIGPKTAVALIKQFGSLDNLYRGLAQVKSESQKQLLTENESMARRSHELAEIDCDVPVDFDLRDVSLREPDCVRLTELLKRFEFKALLREMIPAGEADATVARAYRLIVTENDLAALVNELKAAPEIAVDTETTSSDPHLAHLVGLSFSCCEKAAAYVPVKSPRHQGGGLAEELVLAALKPVLEDPRIKKLGQNIKYDWMVLKNHGIELSGVYFDTMVASYLINPTKRNHNLDDISFEYLDVKKIATKDLIGNGKKEITMDCVPMDKVGDYACEDADCVYRLKQKLAPMLAERGLEKLFYELEMPLVETLARVEMNGVKIDREILGALSKSAETSLGKLEGEIYGEAGGEFNINSPRQLGEVLFVKLGLPAGRKTKTGFSTDVEVLEKLAENYKLPKLLLEYREHSKLKSTYLDALPELINPRTGLIHTSFNQTVTATGRLSSSEPNLQNIPIRTELGRRIRKAFVPRGKGRRLLSADYSQIELRLLAHFSEDPALRKAFRDDTDIHRFTATVLYNVKESGVTYEMRNLAKTINFSILYGKTPFGLSRDLGIPIEEADAFIKAYFARYPRVREFLEAQKEKAKQDGFLTTILGRRAYFPDLKSPNATLRQFAERAAINAPLQGSAADLIKLAMLAIDRELAAKKSEARMILQVHDELVFDAPGAEMPALKKTVRELMEGALTLCVPLKVDLTEGDSWYKES